MHNILAYEDYGGMCMFLLVEVLVLCLSLFAIAYAIDEESKKAIIFIAPAVLWEIFFVIQILYFIIRDLTSGSTILTFRENLTGIISGIIGGFVCYMMVPLIMILITGLILRHKRRVEIEYLNRHNSEE